MTDPLEGFIWWDGRRKKPPPKPIPHGTTTGYARGCRCDECRRAHAEYHCQHRWEKRRAEGRPERDTRHTRG